MATPTLAPFPDRLLQGLPANLRPGSGIPLCVAISGGLDSVVLTRTLHTLGFDFFLAHINYGLRGPESDGDEAFVRELAREMNRPVEIRHVAATEWKSHESIQNQARLIRYRWFDTLLEQGKADFVVLGHHADDQAETVLFRFLRGSGPKGLAGMRPVSGKRLRPMLEFSRSEIQAEAIRNQWAWREDSSNATDRYTRNRIRHTILPRLETEFPGLRSILLRNARRFSRFGEAMELHQSRFWAQCQPLAGGWVVDTRLLQSDAVLRWIWMDELEALGFHADDLEAAIAIAGHPESRTWLSAGGANRLERRGNRMAWGDLPGRPSPTVLETPEALEKFGFDWKKINPPLPEPEIRDQMQHPGSCIWPWENLHFPLTIRGFLPGDRIRLPGMQGKRKSVADLLSESGFLPREKETAQIWENARGEIFWIPGLRQADPFPFPPDSPIILIWKR